MHLPVTRKREWTMRHTPQHHRYPALAPTTFMAVGLAVFRAASQDTPGTAFADGPTVSSMSSFQSAQ
jgi:hypothetical protein